MTLYLLRRLTQTILFIVLAWLTVYTVLVYVMPSGPAREYQAVQEATWEPERIRGYLPNTPEQRTAEQRKRELDSDFALNRPWPFSFLFWLFDPEDVTRVDYDNDGAIVP